MSSPFNAHDGKTEEVHQTAPDDLDEAFEQWWKVHKAAILRKGSSKDQELYARAMIFGAMFAGLSWAMAVPPVLAVSEMNRLRLEAKRANEQQKRAE